MIPVNEPLLQGNEKKYLNECIDTGWISSEGSFVQRLEQDFAARCGRRFGIAVANGTVALEAAMIALDLPKGSAVILPSFTIISCAAAIVRAGLTPIAIDSDPLTWNIDTSLIEAHITPDTSAIMMVHIYGIPTDIKPIQELAQKYQLKIIEDAAEQIGQTYHNQPIGSFGEISTVSFYPNKHITTGEGGMILTDDAALAERCRALRNLCFVGERRFLHHELGWNYRMTNLQAAIGVAQLEQLDTFIDLKRRIGKYYDACFADLIGTQIEVQPAQTAFAENIYWVYGIVLKDHLPFNAATAMQILGQKGIGTRPFFYPMHQQPALHQLGFCQNQNLPVAERLAQRGFYIPSGLALTEAQQAKVSEAVHELFSITPQS